MKPRPGADTSRPTDPVLAAGDRAPPFSAVPEPGGRFHVVNETGRVLVVCRDQHSADEYAVLLSEAWRRGYKAGHRDGRAHPVRK